MGTFLDQTKIFMKYIVLFLFTLLALMPVAHAEETLHYLLTPETAPSGLSILPKPPAYNSVAFLNDEAQYHAGYALKGSKRWLLARADADLGSHPDHQEATSFARQFEGSFSKPITKQSTPMTYRILQEIKHDASFVTKSAKTYYMRTRPFVFFNQPTCASEGEKYLRTSGSYPSGHTTLGWATALVLAEINPKRQNQILARGYDYGQSRVICGAHWQSDVDAGRVAGAALITRLHADLTFQAWIRAAQKEVQK